jgi:hypothetical protein
MCPLKIETIPYYKPIGPLVNCVDPYITHSPQRKMCPLRIETIPKNH